MGTQEEMALIGVRLRDAREAAQLSKHQAGEAVGVSPLTISNWEAGRNLPNLLQCRDLTQLYGVAPAQLLFGRSFVHITPVEAKELLAATSGCSEGLQRRVALILSVLDRSGGLRED